MSFVKLDEKILYSSVWFQDPDRMVFITALLRARPCTLAKAMPQLRLDSLEPTGWLVPAGEYGLVEAAGVGLVRLAVIDPTAGMAALERLGSPEADSGSEAFDGRRLIRIDGGFVVLNYEKYRQKDHTAAERQRRYRERKQQKRAEKKRHWDKA